MADRPEGGWLPPDQASNLLRAFGIPVVNEMRVSTPFEAATAARGLGFPVVLKAVGDSILHKSDIGAVQLGLSDAAQVHDAFIQMSARLGDTMQGAVVQPIVRGVETIAGVVSDPSFGPVIMFGSGGTAVELFEDRVFRILPLTDTDAHEMVRAIRGAPLLLGHRGATKCDVAALEDVLLRVARLAEDVPQVTEMDLNPLIASPEGVVAVDVRVRLGPWRRHPENEIRRLR